MIKLTLLLQSAQIIVTTNVHITHPNLGDSVATTHHDQFLTLGRITVYRDLFEIEAFIGEQILGGYTVPTGACRVDPDLGHLAFDYWQILVLPFHHATRQPEHLKILLLQLPPYGPGLLTNLVGDDNELFAITFQFADLVL